MNGHFFCDSRVWLPFCRLNSVNQVIKTFRRNDQGQILPIKILDPVRKCFYRQHISDYPLCDAMKVGREISRVEAESPNQVDGYVGNILAYTHMTIGKNLITPSA